MVVGCPFMDGFKELGRHALASKRGMNSPRPAYECCRIRFVAQEETHGALGQSGEHLQHVISTAAASLESIEIMRRPINLVVQLNDRGQVILTDDLNDRIGHV